MAIIALEGMRFFAYHGVYEEEQEKGNYFEVDVYVDTGSWPLPTSDEIEDADDYSELYGIVAEVMGERKNLLESLVVEVGGKVMEKFPHIVSARVRVSKDKPPVKGEVRRAMVEELFKRG